MHYYTHNIGEFAAKTRFLSPEEIGIYVILKDEYFANGMRIACDRIANLMPPECEASLQRVLRRFFVVEDGCYVSHEFDRELESYKDRGSINAQNAKKRWEKKRLEQASDAKSCESHATCIESDAKRCLTNNQEPITNNQEIDIDTRAKPARRPTQKLVKPEGVSDEVWDEYQAFKRKVSKGCTQRMVDALVRESGQAGITPEAAMIYQLEHGWTGFEAEWYLNQQQRTASKTKSNAPLQFDDAYYGDGSF